MKNIIPKDTRYVPLTQQPYCCAPTCIQMVMLKNNIVLQPLEIMASHMDIVVSEEKKGLFWNLPYATERPQSGFGTTVSEDKTVNEMLRILNIPLSVTFKFIDDFSSEEVLLEYLEDALINDNDVILCYDFGHLFSTGKHSGHTSVFDTIDLEAKEVRFIDPESTSPKWQIVTISRLYEAMKNHGSKYMAGCWEVKKRA